MSEGYLSAYDEVKYEQANANAQTPTPIRALNIQKPNYETYTKSFLKASTVDSLKKVEEKSLHLHSTKRKEIIERHRSKLRADNSEGM